MAYSPLDYFRDSDPRFNDVPDDTLTAFIGGEFPEFLQDEAFNKRYEAVKGQRQARADQAAFDTTAAGRIARASNAVGDAAYTGAAIGKRLWLGTKQGLEQGLPSAVGGLYDFFGADGSDLRLGAQEIGREYQAEGERIGGGELAQLSQEFGGSLVPSFAPSLAVAPLVVLGAPGAITAGALAVGAALISAGSTMADAIEGYKEQGLSERDAIRSARLPSAATGIATGIITRLGMKFGGDLESTLMGIMAGKVSAAPLASALKTVLSGSVVESGEEMVDQVASSAIAKASYRPGMTAGEFISDVAKAALFGAATRGMLGAVEVPARVLGAQPPAAPPAQPPSPDTTQPATAAVTQPAPAAVTQPAPAAVTQPAPAAVTQPATAAVTQPEQQVNITGEYVEPTPENIAAVESRPADKETLQAPKQEPSTAREDLLNQALIEAQKVKPKKKKQDNKARVPLPPAAPLTEAEVEAARSGVAAAVSSLSDLDRFPAAPIGLPAEPETPADLRAALPPDATRTEVPPPQTITGSNEQTGSEMPATAPSPAEGVTPRVKPPRVDNIGAIPTPEEEARWVEASAFNAAYVNSLSDEDLEAFGARVGVQRQGVSLQQYRQKILNNTHPDDLLDAIPEPTAEVPAPIGLPAEPETPADLRAALPPDATRTEVPPPQTITGSNEQTGSEMPASPQPESAGGTTFPEFQPETIPLPSDDELIAESRERRRRVSVFPAPERQPRLVAESGKALLFPKAVADYLPNLLAGVEGIRWRQRSKYNVVGEIPHKWLGILASRVQEAIGPAERASAEAAEAHKNAWDTTTSAAASSAKYLVSDLKELRRTLVDEVPAMWEVEVRRGGETLGSLQIAAENGKDAVKEARHETFFGKAFGGDFVGSDERKAYRFKSKRREDLSFPMESAASAAAEVVPPAELLSNIEQEVQQLELQDQTEGLDAAGRARLASLEVEMQRQAEAPTAESFMPGAVATFTTSRGSNYALFPDGTTQRDKAVDALHEDGGLKRRSSKTVYSSVSLSNLSAAGLTAPPGTKWRVVLDGSGKASLVSKQPGGVWGVSPSARDVVVSDKPFEGAYLLELWDPANDFQGLESYKGMHAGSQITSIRGVPSPKPKFEGSFSEENADASLDFEETASRQDADLVKSLKQWLLGRGPKPQAPRKVYRGVPPGTEPAREGYTHATPWMTSALKGGKIGGEHDVYSFPTAPDTRYYRGGALEGAPLEATRIPNLRGATWDSLLEQARALYEQDIRTARAEEGSYFAGTTESETAARVASDFKGAAFEVDAANRPGRWADPTTPIPEGYLQEYPELLTPEEESSAPNAELPSDQSNEELQPEGNDGREVLQGTPPVERAGDQRLVVEGGLGNTRGVDDQQESPPEPLQADGGAEPVAVRDAPAARVTAAVEDLPPELSSTFDLDQVAEFAATASPEAESGIQLLGQHADLIVGAAQSTGITPRIWLSSAVGGSGFAASLDGSTLFFDPAAFATALPTMLANAKNAKASGTKSYFARFTEGLKTLIEEEMIHLASYRALRGEHAESGDTRTFEEWIADLERGLVESAPALAASVRALYGFDTEFLGAEMLRMYLQWARHTEGEQIFTESGDTFFRAGKRNIERNLIKAFKGTDRSTLLGQAFDWIVGRFRKDEAARVREIGNRVLKFIEKARKAPEPKRGRPTKGLDSGSVQALYESSKARQASMSPEELAAFEQAEAQYQRMLAGDGLNQAVLKKLQSPGMLNAYPSERVLDIARYAAMRNILTSLNKLAGKATTFAELFGKGGIDFNKSINYAVVEAASDSRISEPDPTDPEGKRRRFLPSAFSEESLDKRREDFNQEVEDPQGYDDTNDILDTARPDSDVASLFDAVWSEIEERASVFDTALRAGGQDEHAEVFHKWATGTDWRQLTTLHDFGDRVQEEAASLGDEGELLMEAVAAFGKQREVRGLLGRLAGVEADEPLGPRAASPGDVATEFGSPTADAKNLTKRELSEAIRLAKDFKSLVAQGKNPATPTAELVEPGEFSRSAERKIAEDARRRIAIWLTDRANMEALLKVRQRTEPLGPRAASPGELPPPIKFSSTGPLGAGLLQPLEAPAADLSSRRLYLSQHRKTHADLSRLLEKANDIRVANGEEPLSLSSEELPSYASSIGLTPEQAAAQARDVLLEKQASRIAGLTARAQEAADLRQRVYDNTRDENYLAFANANHDKAMKALRKALVRMNKDNAESAPEILQRARVIVRAEENYVDQHAAKQVLNGRLVKNITRAVGGDDSPLTLFTLLADELDSIQQRLRKPLSEDAKEEDILEKERARGQIALLQQDLAGLRRSSIQAEEELRTLEKQRAPLIEDLQQELRESSTVEADALNYINDLLRVKKGGTATGTLLPQSEIEALRERSAAVARLIQALSVAEDGTLRDSILDVMLNPPARFTPAKQLLITIGKRYGKTRDQMARDLGVTLSVLEGVMEDAMHDPSIAEMAANLAGYFQSRPYVEKFSAITDPEADIDSLLSGARWTERTIRRGVRRKLQKLRAHQVAVRKQQMTVDFLNRLRSRPEFQQVEQFLDNPPDAADTGWERMVEVGDAAIDVRGFEASGVRQGALTILPQAPPKIREHQMAALLKWRDNAKTYIQGFHKALGAVSTGGTAPDVLGYDLRVVRGLQRTLAQDFENIYVALANEAQNGASAPFGLVAAMSPDTLGVLGIGKNIISKVFAQPLRVIKHIGVPIAPLVERAMVEATRVDRGITASHEKHPDIVSSLRKAALSHGKKWDFERYDQEVFQLLAREARQFKSPVKVGYVLPSGHAVTADDIALLKKLMGAYQSLSQYVEGIEEVDTASDRRRVFVRKARPVGDYSVSRREDHGRIYDLALTLRDLQTQTGADFKLEDTVATLAPGTWQETFWDSAPDVLLSYVFDSERSDTDRVGKFDPTLKEALKKWAQWVRNSGNYKLLNGDTIAGVEGSLTIDMLVNGDPQQGAPGLVDLIGESETEARTRARLAKELTPYIRRIASEYAPAGSVNQSSIVTLQVKSNSSQFTRPAAKLQYPSGLYRYGSTNPREVNSLFSSPRMASEIKVLNLMKQAVQQSRAMLDRGEFPKGRFRSIAQFRKMVRALELVTGQFEKATDKIGTGEDRLTDFDIPVHLKGWDLMGYLTSSVLAAANVVLRNGFFAQMAPFLHHARIHGVFAGLRKLSFGLNHFTATTLLSLLYASGSYAAEGVDALVGRFGGRAEFLRTMDGFIDRYLETSLERFGLDIRRRSRSLADSGMQHRPKLRKQLAEVHALLSNDLTAIRNAKGTRRESESTVGAAASALTIGTVSAIEAVKKKIGIDVTDKFVNVGLEHYAKEALRMLEDMAVTYGRHMEKVNGADSEFDPLSAAWQIRPDRNVLDLSSSKLQALRDAYSLGMSFERVLWDLYQDQKLSHEAGLAASRGDAVDVEQLKAVKGRVADYREDLKIRLIEEMNSPGRFNRSLETRINSVWRALSPLQGYTGDHFLKILEFLGTNNADDDAVRKMAKFFYRLLAYLGAAAVTGLVAITAGEKVKRKVERRSTGMPVLGDPDFNRDMIRAFDHLMKGEVVKAGRSASQIFVGMASAIPYAGDFMLIGLDHYGITPSRGHLLDVTSRSLYFDFVNQAFMASIGVLAAATEGHGVDTALFAADDFLYRWTPYYGTAGVVAEKLGVPGASGSREKYLNTLALRRDAVASGLTEPRRSNFSGAGYYSTLTVFKRRLSDAMSARDREALTQAFSELVNYYRENKRGGRRRSRSEAVRLARGVVEQMSPVLRGTNRARITRQESVRLRRGATGERRGRIDEALQDYAWGARRLGADVTPEIRNSR